MEVSRQLYDRDGDRSLPSKRSCGAHQSGAVRGSRALIMTTIFSTTQSPERQSSREGFLRVRYIRRYDGPPDGLILQFLCVCRYAV